MKTEINIKVNRNTKTIEILASSTISNLWSTLTNMYPFTNWNEYKIIPNLSIKFMPYMNNSTMEYVELSPEMSNILEDVLYKIIKKKLKNNIESREIIIKLKEKDFTFVKEYNDGYFAGYHIKFELGKKFNIIFK